jgi:hypothetical protein
MTMPTADRRRFLARLALRGAGVAVALPLLESLRALGHRGTRRGPRPGAQRVRGSGDVPTRMAVLYVPNGVNLKEWRPGGVGAGYRLGRSLTPLEPFRDDLQVITALAPGAGVAAPDGGGAHARAMATILTGVRPRKTAGADIQAGVSFDQVAAATLGDATRFSSLELSCDGVRKSGACDAGYSCAYSFNMSWRSPRQPAAPESSPRLVFERLFGAGTGAERAASLAARLESQRSVLDFVLDEVKLLEPRLGHDDRARLDEYLGSVRAVERQIEKFERLEPPVVADHDLPESDPDDYARHIRLLADMLVLAFRTDSTRIATFILAHDGGDRTFPELGVDDGHHTLSHHRGDRSNLEKLARVDRFYADQLAYVLGKLRAAEEPGGGTLLDHSMVLYASGISDGDKHRHDDLPVILAGHASGRLAAGRHVKLPGERPMANLFLTMLDLMGAPQPRFADSTGPLDDVRA